MRSTAAPLFRDDCSCLTQILSFTPLSNLSPSSSHVICPFLGQFLTAWKKEMRYLVKIGRGKISGYRSASETAPTPVLPPKSGKIDTRSILPG